jgi:uncharacterized DUF497 family protein
MHGIGFAEAATVLEDERAITREDEDSVGEERLRHTWLARRRQPSGCCVFMAGLDGHPAYF